MFVSPSHIPQLLPKEAYLSQAQFDCEIEHLFMPAWHCIGTTRQLVREGDFFTRRLFGRPLLVCRLEGEPRVFLNVCAHRSSLLTSQARGCNPTLRCQYHGWEYDAQGHTRKIPDAPNFRPLAREMAALKRYRLGICGQLIFVSLADDGPSLEEFLGSGNTTTTQNLFPPTSFFFADSVKSDVNWKVACENGLESYHIECVHRKTLGTYPAEADCRHEFHDRFTIFESSGDPPSWHRTLREGLYRRIGHEPTRLYHHLHVYPNLFYTWDDAAASVQSFFPLAPNRVEIQFFSFIRQGPSSAAPWNFLMRVIGPLGCLFWRRVVGEDMRLLPKVQQGIEAADAPTGGLLSRREERVAHFQAYIARETGISALHALPTFPESAKV